MMNFNFEAKHYILIILEHYLLVFRLKSSRKQHIFLLICRR